MAEAAVRALSPFGTARAKVASEAPGTVLHTADPDQLDLAYLGWEIARAATGLTPPERRAMGAVAAAVLSAIRAGSTRVPLDARLEHALAAVDATAELPAVRALLVRALAGDASVSDLVGPAGGRTPLVVDGEWLYAERMRVLDERFSARVRERLAAPRDTDVRAVNRALKAVSEGPPPLTDEQRKAVRAALTEPLALITGGPGTGKTTIVVSVLRALAWTGLSIDGVAVAAPTGKAAQRLQQAIDAGLAAAPRDLAESTLRSIVPAPQTIHRLLGWSPSSGRFARHENDPLPYRVVIVDEASMIDLAIMDRLLRALRPRARLVLLGDSDQLPSIEAGAVFRDLCAALGGVRLTVNLRVASDPAARRIVAAAEAVNAGAASARLDDVLRTRSTVADLAFEGVEHLAARWRDVSEPLLDRWWRDRAAAIDDFERRRVRTFRLRDGAFDQDDARELRVLFDHHASSRLLCVTRVRGPETAAEELNDRLLARLRSSTSRFRRRGAAELAPGAPVLMGRNDYERQLFNGDQGLVVNLDRGAGVVGLAAVFPRREAFEAFPLDSLADLAPAFAMTVHKAQGSEFDHAALVLPEADTPLLTRELLYTAVTRARRSVLIVGELELLARAVARPIERYSGIAERLAETSK
jgi:exodeoxyribonuclease V alpha subunit